MIDSEKHYQYSDEDYFHMIATSDYVFATIPGSPERDRRLSEISEKDKDRLWDFYCGKLSGRIKEPKTQQQTGGKNYMTYEQFKKISKSSASVDMVKIINFEREFPVTATNYKKRMENEQKWRSEIMSITDRRKRLETISRNLSLFGC